jgi:hypothetical protein
VSAAGFLGDAVMANRSGNSQAEQDRMAADLQKAFEVTELALELRLSVMRQERPDSTIKDLMHEIRLAKEKAWRPSRS